MENIFFSQFFTWVSRSKMDKGDRKQIERLTLKQEDQVTVSAFLRVISGCPDDNTSSFPHSEIQIDHNVCPSCKLNVSPGRSSGRMRTNDNR